MAIGNTTAKKNVVCSKYSTTCTASALLGSTTHCFTVRAVSSVGPGNWSNPPSCFQTSSATAPEAPNDVHPVTTSQFGLGIGWETSRNNGALVLGYDVEIRWEPPASQNGDREAGLPEWAPGCTVKGGANECTVSSLLPGNDYDVRVRANNSVGDGEWTEVGKLHTDHLFSQPPNATVNLTETSAGCGKLQVNWPAVTAANDGGAMVLGYDVEMGRCHIDFDHNPTLFALGPVPSAPPTSKRGSSTSHSTSSNDPCEDAGGKPIAFASVYSGRLLEAVVSDLAGDASYCFRARARNSKGTGVWGTIHCHRTPGASTPGAPELLPAPVDTSSTSITVGWLTPDSCGAAITSFNLESTFWWTDAPLAYGCDYIYTEKGREREGGSERERDTYMYWQSSTLLGSPPPPSSLAHPLSSREGIVLSN